jgi:hypothetical protein
MPAAAYYRAWRAAHPEYRARQNRLRAERRRLNGRGDRSAEYKARPSLALPPIPELHQGHPFFDRARAIVGPRRSTLTVLADPLPDDLIAVAVLALVEGADPREAVRRFKAIERAWGRITAPLLGELAA